MKFPKILALIPFLMLLFGCGAKKEKAAPPASKAGPKLKGEKVLMVIAPKGFRDEEYSIPREILEKAGAEITVASASTEKATGMLGMVVKPDTLLEKVQAADYDAVIFVGGIGTTQYWEDQAALKLAKDACAEGKVLGAICFAPVILANAGVLKGKRATVSPSVADRLRAKGAIYTGEDVVVAGKIVTGSGPQAAREFAQALVNLLVSEKETQQKK